MLLVTARTDDQQSTMEAREGRNWLPSVKYLKPNSRIITYQGKVRRDNIIPLSHLSDGGTEAQGGETKIVILEHNDRWPPSSCTCGHQLLYPWELRLLHPLCWVSPGRVTEDGGLAGWILSMKPAIRRRSREGRESGPEGKDWARPGSLPLLPLPFTFPFSTSWLPPDSLNIPPPHLFPVFQLQPYLPGSRQLAVESRDDHGTHK